jgi:hypothetical protein
MLFPALIAVGGLLIALGLSVPGGIIVVRLVEILSVLALLVFVLIVLQVVSFRNPAIELRDDALLYYGVTIPWSGISGTYLGTSNLTMVARGEEDASFPQDRLWLEIKDQNGLQVPVPSRRIMYHLARLDLRVSGGYLPLPLVKECSAEELAREVRESIER